MSHATVNEISKQNTDSLAKGARRAEGRGPPRITLHRGQQRGFTLIEILVVLVVLAILASLVAPNVFRNVDTAKETTARTQIEMLGAALDAYRLDNGRYPSTEQGLAALQTAPAGEPRASNWRGPYLRKDVPMDPWGKPYVYRFPSSNGKAGFTLATLGADGQPGGEAENADIPETP